MYTVTIWILAFLGCVFLTFLAVVLHECGHIIAAYCANLKVKKIGITWKGAYIKRESGTPRLNILVSAAGPAMNIIVGFILLHIFPLFAMMNLILGFVNLIPMLHSDGERIMNCLAIIKKEKHVTPTTT